MVRILILLNLVFLLGCTVANSNKKAAVTLATGITISAIGGPVAGSANQPISWAVNATLAANPITLEYSLNGGGSWTTIVSGAANSSPYMWSVPAATNTATAQVRVTAVPTSGSNLVAVTANFTIDSTLPVAPLMTLTSAATTFFNVASISVSNCTGDQAYILFNETGVAPLAGDVNWQTCGPSFNYTTTATPGAKTVYGWTKDLAGNVSASSNTVALTLEAAPTVTLTSGSYSNSSNVTMSISSCAGISNILINESIGPAPGSGDPSWVPCTTTPSYTVAGQGAHPIYVWFMDSGSNVDATSSTVTMTYDTTPPVVSAVLVDGGAVYTGTAFATITVTATDTSPLQIRVQEAAPITNDCQSQYADTNWQAYTTSGTPQNYSLSLSFGNGSKYVCAWAKDSAGNVSVIAAPSTGTVGVNMNTISFQVGNPPVITAFSVTNGTAGGNFGTTIFNPGDMVSISWSATDGLGLNNNPIALSYSTDNVNWYDIPSYPTLNNITTPSNITWLGGLAGNPTSGSGTYTTFVAPTASYFRVQAIALNVSGSTSVRVQSDSLNTPNWSIYAGTNDRGVGGTANSAVLYVQNEPNNNFAANPLTNDIVAVDSTYGIRQVSSQTGILTTYIKDGANAMAGSVATATLDTTQSSVRYDSNGYLYVLVNANASGGGVNSSAIAQVAPNGTVTTYVGGGTAIDGTGGPLNAFVQSSPFALDESNSLYFWANCNPGTWDTTSTTNAMRLMKVTQNPDSSAGTVSIVAGNCANSAPPGGGPNNALTNPVYYGQYPAYVGLTVWNNGQTIYYGYGAFVRKILNGQLYSTAITAPHTQAYPMLYDKYNGKLYLANSEVDEWTPNLAGANGETSTVFVANTGTGTCTSDGVAAGSACLNNIIGFDLTASGVLLFGDGGGANNNRPYRVRYKDNNGNLQTVAGSLPFFGNGLDKTLIRGSLSGIYYKQATEPNQAAFPAGLYFMESDGIVLGYANPTATVIAGNQAGIAVTSYPTGTVASPGTNLGISFGGGSGRPLMFDANGLPWFRFTHVVDTIDATGKLMGRQDNSTTQYWEDLGVGSVAVQNGGVGSYGLQQNLQINGSGVFLMGSTSKAGHIRNPVLRFMDFAAGSITALMGDPTIPGSVSLDDNTPGDPAGVPLTLSSACLNGGGCYVQYRQDQDTLYFTEVTKNLRYITSVSSPANSILGTLFTQPQNKNIRNFIFSPDHTQLWYLAADAALHCHDISSGKAWCNDTSMGPPAGITYANGPNQLTWLDAGHLLISSYTGYIYEYTLLP